MNEAGGGRGRPPFVQAAGGQEPLRAPALRPGDAVGVVAPAGVVDQEALGRGLRVLEDWGLRPLPGDSVYAARGYLAGPDAARATDVNRFLRDPDVKAVVAARGGYGTLRILGSVDLAALRRQPKILAGFSDLTALLMAAWQEAGLVTFHGPMLEVHDPSGAMPAYNREGLRRALFGEAFPGEIPWPDTPDAPRPVAIRAGIAQGRLVGGNLEVFTRLVGSPWQPRTAGTILVLEDVDEAPYRVDRMLVHLRLAGLLEGVAGVVFGDSPSCMTVPAGRPSLTLLEVLEDHLGPLGVPVLYGFPCGHGRYRATLPIGAMAELDAGAGRLRVLEPATAPVGA